MCTRISVAIAVVLLVCSVVGAQDILPGSAWQYQDFVVGDLMNPGISSVLNTVHGSGAYAFANTQLDICNSQSTPVCLAPIGIIGMPGQICQANCLTAAGQCQDGSLLQQAEAEGDCAIIGVNAFLDAPTEAAPAGPSTRRICSRSRRARMPPEAYRRNRASTGTRTGRSAGTPARPPHWRPA